VIFQSTKTKQNYYFPNFDKNLGCYRLPPLKEISSPRFEEARKEKGFGVSRWLPPLKDTFVGSLGLWVLTEYHWSDLALDHLLNT
jgi:hypothetical protein